MFKAIGCSESCDKFIVLLMLSDPEKLFFVKWINIFSFLNVYLRYAYIYLQISLSPQSR